MSHSEEPAPRRPRPIRRLLASVGLLAVLGGLLAYVLSDPSAPRPVLPATTPAAPTPERAELQYLALGDSLSRGVQADPARTLTNGYPRQLASALRRDLPPSTGLRRVRLVEAGCGGATTESMLEGGKRCEPTVKIPYENRDAASSQAAWAEQRLRELGDAPTLVTLTIGGNDLLACITPSVSGLRKCAARELRQTTARWAQIADRLAAAAGARTTLVVATTYDPFVGLQRLAPGQFTKARKVLHTFVVDEYNPSLRRTFRRAGWKIADLGRAMRERQLRADGSGPALDAVCELTWACARGDIHLNDEGYGLAASLMESVVLGELGRRG